MSVSMKIDKTSEKNVLRNLKTIEKEYPEKAWEMIVKMLFDMVYLAKNKLKANDHIETSRLRNSISVKTPNKNESSPINYTDKNGVSYDGNMTSVKPKKGEGYFGTNVEYASKIEFMYDSFIYWAAKHVNVTKQVDNLKQELKEIRFVK